jgi:hypothetical protein
MKKWICLTIIWEDGTSNTMHLDDTGLARKLRDFYSENPKVKKVAIDYPSQKRAEASGQK